MAERDRRGITARIDRTNHVPVPINVIAPVAVMLFLLSAEASNLTGAHFATDGGWTAY